MKRLIIAVLIIGAIGGGAGAYYVKHNRTEISVSTVPITRADIVDSVASTGTLQAVISVTVGSQVSGNISFLGADFNSIVHKDQVDREARSRRCSKRRSILAQANPRQCCRRSLARIRSLSCTRSLKTSATGTCSSAASSRRTHPRRRQDGRRRCGGTGGPRQGECATSPGAAQYGPSQPGSLHHHLADRRHRHPAQRRCRTDGSGEHDGAASCSSSAEDLTEMQVSASIDESDVGRLHAGSKRHVPRRRVSRRGFPRDGRADSAEPGRREQRDDASTRP